MWKSRSALWHWASSLILFIMARCVRDLNLHLMILRCRSFVWNITAKQGINFWICASPNWVTSIFRYWRLVVGNEFQLIHLQTAVARKSPSTHWRMSIEDVVFDYEKVLGSKEHYDCKVSSDDGYLRAHKVQLSSLLCRVFTNSRSSWLFDVNSFEKGGWPVAGIFLRLAKPSKIVLEKRW